MVFANFRSKFVIFRIVLWFLRGLGYLVNFLCFERFWPAGTWLGSGSKVARSGSKWLENPPGSGSEVARKWLEVARSGSGPFRGAAKMQFPALRPPTESKNTFDTSFLVFFSETV